MHSRLIPNIEEYFDESELQFCFHLQQSCYKRTDVQNFRYLSLIISRLICLPISADETNVNISLSQVDAYEQANLVSVVPSSKTTEKALTRIYLSMLCCYSISHGIFRDIGCCSKGVTDTYRRHHGDGVMIWRDGLVFQSLQLTVLQMVHVGCSGRERPRTRCKGSGRCSF
jgi:hypothetical protein